jgi:plastocyanin
MRTPKLMRRVLGLALACSCACVLVAQAEFPSATFKVEIVNPQAVKKNIGTKNAVDASNIVIWLTPLDSEGGAPTEPVPDRAMSRITQINKSFDPHVVVIQVGTKVQFPNKDPFLHNVFSLFDGKRFDLGFYEAGSSKTVQFSRPGVSFIFCNIHPEMSGAVVAVDSSYFGISDRTGRVNIPHVPDGRYQMNVWYERSLPEDLKAISRAITYSGATRSVESIRVVENPDFSPEHKNKYGEDYVPPANTSPAYNRP